MLKAIVGDQDVRLRPLCQQKATRRDAIATDGDRQARSPRKQLRFVTARRKRCFRINQAGASDVDAIAAADDAGTPARRLQRFGNREHEGCLAGPAGDEIADDDDGHRQTLALPKSTAIRSTAHSGNGTEQPGKWNQGKQREGEAPAVPPPGKGLGKRHQRGVWVANEMWE